jgi:hypothetical protein
MRTKAPKRPVKMAQGKSTWEEQNDFIEMIRGSEFRSLKG